MKLKTVFAALTLALAVSCSTSRQAAIQVKTPARPAGQESALGLTVPAMDTVRIGFVGIGSRGTGAVMRYTYIPGVKIVALCDVQPEQVEANQKILEERGLPRAAEYSGSTEAYKELCDRDDIDLVYICTDWKHHVPIALYAMEHGKNVAVEVPAASSLEDIWSLVNTCERTRKHCIMLENCCYDFFELSALTMAQKGLLGELIHGEGAYHHNLDPFWDRYWNSWRLDFNQSHKGDVYPTHGLGPVCQAMNIHRGDRFKTIVAMETKSVNGTKHYEARSGEKCEDFQNADLTMTMITTENGKTILVEHDVMTPRPYNRMYQLVGSEGYVGKYPVQQVCLRENAGTGTPTDYKNPGKEVKYSGDELAKLLEENRSPILTPELETLAKKVGGHGGMDFIMDYRLVYCLHNGLPLDMDVYDLAEWCCLTELGKISIENGNAPVQVPDFTRGEWNKIKGFSYAFAE